MRSLLTIILIFHIGNTFGQLFSYPAVTKSGKQLAHFIPNNWALLDSAKADMNKDGNDDLAFVIQYRDSASILQYDYGEMDTVLAQPRILLLAFYNPVTKLYDIIDQSNTFILSHSNPNMEEPFQNISINRGVLKIDFNIFMNSGGWGTFTNSYKFLYQNKTWILIGADHFYVNRGTGETEDRSYNFLTRKVKTSTGKNSTGTKKVKWQTIKITKLKTIHTLTQPFSWKIENSFYL